MGLLNKDELFFGRGFRARVQFCNVAQGPQRDVSGVQIVVQSREVNCSQSL